MTELKNTMINIEENNKIIDFFNEMYEIGRITSIDIDFERNEYVIHYEEMKVYSNDDYHFERQLEVKIPFNAITYTEQYKEYEKAKRMINSHKKDIRILKDEIYECNCLAIGFENAYEKTSNEKARNKMNEYKKLKEDNEKLIDDRRKEIESCNEIILKFLVLSKKRFSINAYHKNKKLDEMIKQNITGENNLFRNKEEKGESNGN